jgi:hypothetical protein
MHPVTKIKLVCRLLYEAAPQTTKRISSAGNDLTNKNKVKKGIEPGIKPDPGTEFGRYKHCGVECRHCAAESGEGVRSGGAPPSFATAPSTSAGAAATSSVAHSTGTGASTSDSSPSEDKSDHSATRSRSGKARSSGSGSAQLALPESVRSSSMSGAGRREAALGEVTGSAVRKREGRCRFGSAENEPSGGDLGHLCGKGYQGPKFSTCAHVFSSCPNSKQTMFQQA